MKHFDIVQYFILCEQSFDFEYPKKIKLRRSGLLIARGFNPGMQWRNNESAEERVGFGGRDRLEAVLRGSYFKPCSVNFSRPVFELTLPSGKKQSFGRQVLNSLSPYCVLKEGRRFKQNLLFGNRKSEIGNRISQIANRPRSDAVRIPPRCPGIGKADRS